MNLPNTLILDAATVAILVISALLGRRRGLIKTVSGILAFALALSLAGTLAIVATPSISEKYVAPYITREVQREVEAAPETKPDSPSEYSLPFEKLGIPENIISDAMDDISKALTQSIIEPLNALSNSVAYKITHTVLFIVFFVLLLLIFKFIFRLVNLASKIPGINFINKTLGLILGLIFGYLIVTTLSFILTSTGFYLTDEMIDKTYVLKLITSFSPASFFAG